MTWHTFRQLESSLIFLFTHLNVLVDSEYFLNDYIVIARQHRATSPVPPTTTTAVDTHSDFYDLPSNPISVYHTGDPWPTLTGPEAQRVPKDAGPVCGHSIAKV